MKGLDYLTRVEPGVFVNANGSPHSAHPSNASNTLAIQAALDEAGLAGGGIVVLTQPGVYLLNAQGTNPYIAGHKYCLDFKYDNVTFYLGNGVTLKLANGQQTNAGGPVDLLIFRGRTNLSFIGEGEGSIITGNTAGQTGWTGGYAQITNGIIISGYGVNAGAANSNITIQNLFLKDHFSNPININSHPATDRNERVRIQNIHASDCGEGIQVINVDDVWVDNCLVDSPALVTVGDGIELSDCTNFYVRNNIVKNHQGASGFDIFGSTDGIVDGWISIDNATGLSLTAFGAIPDPENIIVTNGLVIDPLTSPSVTTGVILSAATLNNIKVQNMTMIGNSTSFGFQVAAAGAIKGTGAITIENCFVDGGSSGILIAAAFPNLAIRGGSYINQVSTGINYIFQGNGLVAADVANLFIEGVVATGNGSAGIVLNNQGFTVPGITGVIRNCILEDNVVAPIAAGPEGVDLTVENLSPNTLTVGGGGAGPIVFGRRFITPTGSAVSSFQTPSKTQEIVILGTTQIIVDRRQTGGNNIDLMGGVNFLMAAADTLTLRYNNSDGRWYEVSRSVNGTTIDGVFTTLALGGGTSFTKAVAYTPSLTPASVAANTSAEEDFTVTGLSTADKVILNGPAPTAGTGIVNVRVKAADTLSITFGNFTAGALTPASGTYNLIALRS